MAERLSRENRVRLFLGFLILVLVVVNSQSLYVSHQSRKFLLASFRDEVRARTESIAASILPVLWGTDRIDGMPLGRRLDELAYQSGLRSICLLDWNGELLAGAGACSFDPIGEFDRLDRQGKQSLIESGLAVSEIVPPSDPETAGAFGYRVIRWGSDAAEAVVRVEVPAVNVAVVNRSFRSTLIYQVSALTLVLLALVLFLNSFLAPHRRLVAEARSVAGGLDPTVEGADESQFLLSTFQSVVARLKEKEKQLEEMHQQEKARADETEALATDIIHSMTSGLVSLDEAGVVVLVNPTAEKIFRMDASAVVGTHFSEAFPGSREWMAWVDSALHDGEFTLRRQVEYVQVGGEAIHLGVSVIPLLAPGGGVRGALCLHADLTEVIHLREKLLLKENLARVGEMVAGIAHEFRNGLATILGNARLLGQTLPQGAGSELIDALIEESHSLSHVVSEFLQFARPETLRVASVDLAVMASELAEELEPRAQSLGVVLDLDAESCCVEADEVLLRKAILNLVLNAMEAAGSSGKGGKVRLGVEAGAGGEMAVVQVSDNGPGIAPENLDRVFTPFFTTKPDGVGLGLALVQKIIVSHNGEVEIESDPEAGTSLILKIPVRPSSSTILAEWV